MGEKMNFSIKRDIFLNGIQKTLGIVERKTTLPILNNILIKAESEQIRIVATDREIGLISHYDAKVVTPGEITVAARKLFEMVREIEGDVIDFKVMENNWVNVTCGKVIYKIPGISADDFPEVSDVKNIEPLKMKCSVLKNIIDKTFFAISNDEMRPNLNGIFFQVIDGKVDVVATDGHRLSLVNVPLEGDSDDNINIKGVIIPRKGVSEIRKLVDDDDYVDVCVMDSVYVVRKKDTTLRISLIDAEYPDYKRVIPEKGGVEIQLDKNQILHSLRRMSVMSTERFSGVKIEVYNQRMVLTSTNPDVGEAKDEIDVSYNGDPLEVGYNVRYLIDAMEPIDENIVSFEVRGDEGPGVIGSAENRDYMCIVMPVKLRKD
ncbi:MAG: DNA polymerase III subunit beta [Syntrophobacterales bacterium]|nr:DNA polymerase III subunit beta [Syntrophobacterales bacterium]